MIGVSFKEIAETVPIGDDPQEVLDRICESEGFYVVVHEVYEVKGKAFLYAIIEKKINRRG